MTHLALDWPVIDHVITRIIAHAIALAFAGWLWSWRRLPTFVHKHKPNTAGTSRKLASKHTTTESIK